MILLLSVSTAPALLVGIKLLLTFTIFCSGAAAATDLVLIVPDHIDGIIVLIVLIVVLITFFLLLSILSDFVISLVSLTLVFVFAFAVSEFDLDSTGCGAPMNKASEDASEAQSTSSY